ncbi:hypothetical protein [Polaromonas eurypsychrophila]|uniref:hypothetical protein n=1 Tax=Polaromonas eurypsychrophila TaxID=1614635 RepID=UPI00166BE3F6|nr:hypothetical protein [Polaromonas eurypsychrophila]
MDVDTCMEFLTLAEVREHAIQIWVALRSSSTIPSWCPRKMPRNGSTFGITLSALLETRPNRMAGVRYKLHSTSLKSNTSCGACVFAAINRWRLSFALSVAVTPNVKI